VCEGFFGKKTQYFDANNRDVMGAVTLFVVSFAVLQLLDENA
jgi:hypothetical protein